MKGGVAAILGAVRALRDAGRAGRAPGRAHRRVRPVRGGRRAGDARGDPRRRDGRPVRHPGAVGARRRHRPRGRDHVPAHRPGPRGPRQPPDRGRVGARQPGRRCVRALEADEARRNAAETEPLMTALGLPYPTIIGTVAGGEWASTVMDRIVADGRYGVRLGQTPEAAEASSARASRPPARATRSSREHPATVEITGARFASSRVPVGHRAAVTGLAGGHERGDRPAARPDRRPVRRDMRLFIGVGDTPCVDLRARRRPAGPRRRRVACRWPRSRPAPGCSPPGSRRSWGPAERLRGDDVDRAPDVRRCGSPPAAGPAGRGSGSRSARRPRIPRAV